MSKIDDAYNQLQVDDPESEYNLETVSGFEEFVRSRFNAGYLAGYYDARRDVIEIAKRMKNGQIRPTSKTPL